MRALQVIPYDRGNAGDKRQQKKIVNNHGLTFTIEDDCVGKVTDQVVVERMLFCESRASNVRPNGHFKDDGLKGFVGCTLRGDSSGNKPLGGSFVDVIPSDNQSWVVVDTDLNGLNEIKKKDTAVDKVKALCSGDCSVYKGKVHRTLRISEDGIALTLIMYHGSGVLSTQTGHFFKKNMLLFGLRLIMPVEPVFFICPVS